MGAEELFNAELLKELGANNQFFDNLVDMIPAKLYVVGNSGDDAYNPKYRKGQHKESKEARRARNKQAKKDRYDPTLAESTTQTKTRKDKEAYEDVNDSDDDDDDEHFVPPDGDQEDHEEEEEEETPLTPAAPKEEKEEMELDIPTEGLSRIEILRAKLHAKIAQKRAQSNRFQTHTTSPHNTNTNTTNNNNNTNADATGNQHKSQTISKRAARKAERQRQKQLAIARKNANGGATTVGGKKGISDRQIHVEIHKQPKTTTTPPPPPKPSLKEDLAGINFGSIAGLTMTDYYKDNKSLKPKQKKNLEKLLHEAQEKQKRLQELKAGDERDKAQAKRILWGETLKEASGERSKNDPTKIKKAMKRKATKKAKSAIAWKARLDKTKDSMKERQSIRTHNLNQRKIGGSAGANLSKKRIVTEDGKENGGPGASASAGGDSKRRRLGPHADKSRAGFEGKKQGFINNKDKKKKGSSSVTAK